MIWVLLGGIPLAILCLLGLIAIVLDEPGFVACCVLFFAAVFSVLYGLDQLGIGR